MGSEHIREAGSGHGENERVVIVGLGDGARITNEMERSGALFRDIGIIEYIPPPQTSADGEADDTSDEDDVKETEDTIPEPSRRESGISVIISKLFGKPQPVSDEGTNERGPSKGKQRETTRENSPSNSSGKWLDRNLIARNSAYTRLRSVREELRDWAMEATGGPGMTLVVSDLAEESLDACLLLDALCNRAGKRDVLFLVQPEKYRDIWTVQYLNKRIQGIARCADSVLMLPPIAEGDMDDFLSVVSAHFRMVTRPGTVNIDLADVRHIAGYGNIGLIGAGKARGGDRARNAAKRALDHNMLDIDLAGIDRAIVCVNGGEDMTIEEAESASYYISKRIREGSKIIWGANVSPEMNDRIEVVLLVGLTPHQALLHHYAGT